MTRKNRPVGTEPTGQAVQYSHDNALFDHVRAEIDRRRQTPRIDQRVKDWLTSGDNPYLTRVQWRQATQKLARVAATGLLAVTLAGPAIGQQPPSANAAPVLAPQTITVSTTDDEDDGFLGGGDGISLREAVLYSGDGDTIELGSETYVLTRAGAGEDIGHSGDLDVIGKSLTVVGNGRDNTTIDADGIDRIFHVLPGASLTVKNATITGGLVDDQHGGAFYNLNGSLTIQDCLVTGNETTDSGDDDEYHGGALFMMSTDNNTASTTISGSTFESNIADNQGGAIQATTFSLDGPATTTLLMDTTVITNNQAEIGGGISTGSYLDFLGSPTSLAQFFPGESDGETNVNDLCQRVL